MTRLEWDPLANSVQPTYPPQFVITKLPLPIHHCQFPAGQLHKANSLWRQLTVGGQRETQMGGQVSRWAEHRVVAGVFYFLLLSSRLKRSVVAVVGGVGSQEAAMARAIPFSYLCCHSCSQPLPTGAQCGSMGVCENRTPGYGHHLPLYTLPTHSLSRLPGSPSCHLWQVVPVASWPCGPAAVNW